MRQRWRYLLRLNTALAKKSKDCPECILVHEMIHLLEPTHNARFVALMVPALETLSGAVEPITGQP